MSTFAPACSSGDCFVPEACWRACASMSSASFTCPVCRARSARSPVALSISCGSSVDTRLDLAAALARIDFRGLRRRLRNLLDEVADTQSESGVTDPEAASEPTVVAAADGGEVPTPTFVDRARLQPRSGP